jgi:hypothetical protein
MASTTTSTPAAGGQHPDLTHLSAEGSQGLLDSLSLEQRVARTAKQPRAQSPRERTTQELLQEAHERTTNAQRQVRVTRRRVYRLYADVLLLRRKYRRGHRPRGVARARPSHNPGGTTRHRGSRRTTSRSAGGGSSGGDGPSDEPSSDTGRGRRGELRPSSVWAREALYARPRPARLVFPDALARLEEARGGGAR